MTTKLPPSPDDFNKKPFFRPASKVLSRPMVDKSILTIPIYKTELVADSTGKPDTRVKQVKLCPIEWPQNIVFSDGKNLAVGLAITDILGVSIVSSEEAKGMIRKKEDLMIRIIFRGNKDNLENWVIINLEDKYIDEFMQAIQTLRKNASDDLYWTYRSIIMNTANSQTRTIDIYPLAPFLAEGEEIIWSNMKQEGVINKKVAWIQILTNYRAFQYDYKQHVGIVVLLPSLEDIVVSNQRRTSNTNSIGSYSRSRYHLAGLGTSKTTSMTIGDVSFIYQGKPFIKFTQVSDPNGLASVVKSIRKQQSNMKIGGRIVHQPEPQSVKNSPSFTSAEEQVDYHIQQEDNFLECILPEYNLKINYPATWEKIERKTGLNPPSIIGFRTPKENTSDSFLGIVTISIITNLLSSITLKEYIDLNVKDLRKKYADFLLSESMSTTISAGGIPAYRLVYVERGKKSLVVTTIKENKAYIIMYRHKPEKYLKYLATAEQMVSSFEFLSS